MFLLSLLLSCIARIFSISGHVLGHELTLNFLEFDPINGHLSEVLIPLEINLFSPQKDLSVILPLLSDLLLVVKADRASRVAS